MQGSFWKSNPLVPSWSEFITSWWNSYPPRLLATQHSKSLGAPLHGCIIRKATLNDIYILPEFWGSWFSQSRKTKCCIPLSRVQEAAKDGTWDIWVMIQEKSGNIIGTIVRRWVTNVHVKEAFFPRIGLIDYFCVHPAWRKKGVGRRLLYTVQADTVKTIPHFILWESFQVSIPPIVSGMYWAKRCELGKQTPLSPEEAKIAWPLCKKADAHIFSDYKESRETVIWKTISGYVVVLNTYHRTIPEAHWIGIVIGISSEQALKEFTEACPFGVLLCDTQRDGWVGDTCFQWIAYTLNTGFISTSFPYLCWC
jgi:N-acetylglutamate synthase-like GNAT family acetyltransferase